jgi:hypothetical protein
MWWFIYFSDAMMLALYISANMPIINSIPPKKIDGSVASCTNVGGLFATMIVITPNNIESSPVKENEKLIKLAKMASFVFSEIGILFE